MCKSIEMNVKRKMAAFKAKNNYSKPLIIQSAYTNNDRNRRFIVQVCNSQIRKKVAYHTVIERVMESTNLGQASTYSLGYSKGSVEL